MTAEIRLFVRKNTDSTILTEVLQWSTPHLPMTVLFFVLISSYPFQGWIDSFLNGIKRFLGIKIPSVWEGDFDFGAIAPTFDEDKELLRKKIEEFYSLDSKAFFVEMIGMRKQYFRTHLVQPL